MDQNLFVFLYEPQLPTFWLFPQDCKLFIIQVEILVFEDS